MKKITLLLLLSALKIMAPAQETSLLEKVADVGEIPGMNSQSSEVGKGIKQIFPFNNKIYIGYGDQGRNTGPIWVLHYDPANHSFHTTFLAMTDEVSGFSAINTELYFPNHDPKADVIEEGSAFRLDAGSGKWSILNPIKGAVHCYKAIEFRGKLYVSTGSRPGEAAYVVSSEDKGENWAIEHSTLGETTDSSYGASRYYHLAASGNVLFTSGYIHNIRKQEGEFLNSQIEWLNHEPFAWVFSNYQWFRLNHHEGFKGR